VSYSYGDTVDCSDKQGKLAHSHQFTIKKRCIRKIKLACTESKFSTFLVLKTHGK